MDYEHSKMLRSRPVDMSDDSKVVGGVRPSFITLPQSSISVHEYEPLTLRCVVDGHPKPTGAFLYVLLLPTTRTLTSKQRSEPVSN